MTRDRVSYVLLFLWANGLRLLGLMQAITLGLLGCDQLSAHTAGHLGIALAVLQGAIGYLRSNPLTLPCRVASDPSVPA
jgi:hypothetical protein